MTRHTHRYGIYFSAEPVGSFDNLVQFGERSRDKVSLDDFAVRDLAAELREAQKQASFARRSSTSAKRRPNGRTEREKKRRHGILYRARAARARRPQHLAFWALRGGGNFGVVTSMDLDLHAVGPTMLGGVVFYAGNEAAKVVTGQRDAIAGTPDELTTLVNLTTAPPAPFIPEPWHFKQVAAVIACWAGAPEMGEQVVAPLRKLGTVVAGLLAPIPYVALQQLVDPMWGSARRATSVRLRRRLPDDAIAAYADFHARSGDSPVQAELHIH